MMQGVLVLAGARQEGPYFDVIVSGFCGLVMLECLCFLLYLGFVGVFPLFPLFFFCFFFFFFPSCFGVLFVYFLYAQGRLFTFYKLLCLPIKKNIMRG
jgi:hypothetical protein